MRARSRRAQLIAVAYLAAVVGFAWWSLRGRFDEVGTALADVSVGGLLLGLVLVLAGLSMTALLWLRLMAAFDSPVPATPGHAIFFVGQLGKYLPGSVWAVGAQATLARRLAIPPRVTVTAGLVFLGYNVVTGALVAALAFSAGAVEVPWPQWASIAGVVAALGGVHPALVRRLARTFGGRDLHLGWRDTGVVLLLMAGVWAAYAVALVLWSPEPTFADVFALAGAFAAAYAVGVAVVFAPAGLGAREGVFVLLVAPLTSVPAATALALVARVGHALADAALAGGWWGVSRRHDER